ncbi:MAG: hypothetical protein CL777_03310 [Chloroflexi bacterium]|nr:hypothetical protein [Chloroflexota bacterium]|tara:strand:- start:18818 stop:19774 length:957 start_codon:yes stop_codon:yes gene_type:complete
MPEKTQSWQILYAILVSVIVWGVVLAATWFADRTDGYLGHGPLPSAFDPRNAYIASLLTSVFAILSGAVMIVGVRQSRYFSRFAWLVYAFVALPMLCFLAVPMQRFGTLPFWGFPEFLMGVPARMILATSLGALFLGSIDLRRYLTPLVEQPTRAAVQSGDTPSAAVRGLPGRFTPNAWKALSYMQEEAQRFEHSYMGTEHLLLGLLKDARFQSSVILIDLGADPSLIKREIESVIGRRGSLYTGTTGMTRRCQRVIERAARVARSSGQRAVGTGHLLQSLVEHSEDVAGQLLESSGVTADRVSAELRHMPAETASES